MKFSCTQNELSKALNTVSKAVSSRTTIPVLKGIKISAKKGSIVLSASDLDLFIDKTISADVSEEGEIVVQAKLFSDIIRKLPSGTVYVEEKENKTVTVSEAGSEFTIVGFSSEEFPGSGDPDEDAKELSFDKKMFIDMIRKTSFAASIDESKGIIIGVLIELEEESLNMVAIDGFRMAVNRENIKNAEKKKIVAEARILNEIVKVLSESDDEDENISLLLSKKKAMITLKDAHIIFRLLEGEFLKYKDILPKTCKCTAVVNRQELQASIERASLLAREGRNNLIRMKIEDGEMIITSRSEEGNVFERLSANKAGDSLEIGFNSKYIMDVLKAVDEEEIKMEFNTSVSPCVIKPAEGNHFEYLVLPVRITV